MSLPARDMKRTGRQAATLANDASRRLPGTPRRGIILVVVLVVVALLSLAAYTFAGLMVTHYGAAKLSGRQLQSRALVESGIEAVRLYLMQDDAARDDAGGHFNNPGYFQGIPVLTHDDSAQAPISRCWFPTWTRTAIWAACATAWKMSPRA